MTRLSRTAKLALLQLEQYDTARYLAALRKDSDPQIAKRLRRTFRIRLTSCVGYFMGIPAANRLITLPTATVEKLVYLWVKHRITALQKQGLTVIAIAGSYGKTSVKHYAYEFLRHEFRTVATPESFNTVAGIAKTLFYEVDQRTQVFLVETGAYHIGDIARLLAMIHPSIGVMTGIARQHLERFGSYENIVTAKSEIAVYMKKVGGTLIANAADPAVKKAVSAIGGTVIWYGTSGTRTAVNIDGGRKVAQVLGLDQKMLLAAQKSIRPVPHRFEMTSERYGLRVIDDSYSSNEVGFASAVSYLGLQKKYTRILVTPGLVELGNESDTIHENLGRGIVGNVDYVILVGDSARTRSLARGIDRKVPVIHVDKTLQFMEAVKKLSLTKEPLILLENDLTENY